MSKSATNLILNIFLLLPFISHGESVRARNKHCSFAIVTFNLNNILTSTGIAVFTLSSPLREKHAEKSYYIYSNTDYLLEFTEVVSDSDVHIPKVMQKVLVNSEIPNEGVVYKIFSNNDRSEPIGQFKSSFDPCIYHEDKRKTDGIFDIDGHTLLGLVVPTNNRNYENVIPYMLAKVRSSPCVWLDTNDVVLQYRIRDSTNFCFNKKKYKNYTCKGVIKEKTNGAFGQYENTLEDVKLSVTNPHRYFFLKNDTMLSMNKRISMKGVVVPIKSGFYLKQNYHDDNLKIYYDEQYTNFYLSVHPCTMPVDRSIPIYDASYDESISEAVHGRNIDEVNTNRSAKKIAGYFRRLPDKDYQDE